MSKIKGLSIRLVLWIFFICIPASIGLVLIESQSQKVEIPPLIEPGLVPMVTAPEILELSSSTVPLGTKFADRESDDHSKNKTESALDVERLVSFLSRTQGQQMALLKAQADESGNLKKQLSEQKEKLDMILELSRQQGEQFKNLIIKVAETEKRVGEKVQHDQVNLEKITKMYAGMPPETVAKITEDIDVASLADVFSQMKDKDLAKIMQVLPSKRAAALTMKMGNLTRKVK